MYKNCREELLAVMRAFVIETGENEFSRAEAVAAMRRSGGKYPEGTVSAHLTYRCCANIPTRCYKPMYDDYEKIGKEKREPLNDSQFIEYLYNRAYSILYLLRLKS